MDLFTLSIIAMNVIEKTSADHVISSFLMLFLHRLVTSSALRTPVHTAYFRYNPRSSCDDPNIKAVTSVSRSICASFSLSHLHYRYFYSKTKKVISFPTRRFEKNNDLKINCYFLLRIRNYKNVLDGFYLQSYIKIQEGSLANQDENTMN